MHSLIIRALIAIVVLVAGSGLALAELSDAERQDFLNAAERHESPLAKQFFTALGQKGCQGVTEKEWQHLLKKTVSERTRFHILLTYARCLIDSKTRADEAIKIVQEALSLQPDSYTALFILGQAHLQLGEDEDAIEAFQQVEAMEGTHSPQLYDGLGFLKFRMASGPLMVRRKLEREELLREAEAYFEQAISMKPWHPNYHYHLSLVYISQAQYEEAIDKIKEAIALVPDFEEWNEQEKTFHSADYYVSLGQKYAFYQKWDEAEEWINKGINHAPPGKFREHLKLLGKATLLEKEIFFDPWPLEGEQEHEAGTN